MADTMTDRVECPVCGKFWAHAAINTHVNKCLNEFTDPSTGGGKAVTVSEECQESERPKKRAKTDAFESRITPAVPATAQSRPESVCLAAAATGKPPQMTSKSPGDKISAWGSLMQSKPPKTSQHTTGTRTGVGKPFFASKLSNQNECSEVHGDVNQGKVTSDVIVQEKPPSPRIGRSSTSGFPKQVEHTNFRPKPSIMMKAKDGVKDSYKPLAEKMRPKSLKDYVGQESVVGHKKLLRLLVESHHIPSMILWGPPGCGKTTLARIIAEKCKETHDTRFVQLSATTSGVADVKEAVKVAKNERSLFKRKTVLFIDEVHRFNKLQQDSFLPHIEDGTIILIGATTENPSFQVNNALLSRCRVMVLEKLSAQHVESILHRALDTLGVELNDPIENNEKHQKGGSSRTRIQSAALAALSHLCDGDARSALNGLQHAVECKEATMEEDITDQEMAIINVDDIKEALQRSHVQYDRNGEEHYNCASAFQKSIRGSCDNGAIYWLARMVEGGEDPLFIARRLVVCASEDIGLADPQALPLAMATFQACQVIGMPECAINLAHCTTYLARAPKSNEAYQGLREARKSIHDYHGPLPGVPLHLRNAPTKLLKDIGYGVGYKYNHSIKGPVEQEYLPESLKGVSFFHN